MQKSDSCNETIWYGVFSNQVYPVLLKTGIFSCFPLQIQTGLQSQHLPAAALERPQAEASAGF